MKVTLSKDWRTWLLVFVLFFLFLGGKDMGSAKVRALLPWMLLPLFDLRTGLICLRQLQGFRVLVVLTVGLSSWILLAESLRGITSAGLTHCLQFLCWIPIAILVTAQSHRDKQFMATLCASALLYLWLVFGVLAWQRWHVDDPRPRAFGHNVLIGSIIFGVFCVCISTKPRSLGTYTLAFAGLGLIASIFTTAARAPILTVTVSIVISALIADSRHRLRWLISTGVVFSGLLLANWERVQVFAADIMALDQGKRLTSTGVRLDAWNYFLSAFNEHPMLGKSIQGTQDAFNRVLYQSADKSKWAYPYEHLHNDFLQLSTSYGLAAGVLFLVFLISLGYTFLRSASKVTLTSLHLTAFAAFAFVLNILLAGFTDSFTFFGSTQIAIQAILGTLVAVTATALAHSSVQDHHNISSGKDAIY